MPTKKETVAKEMRKAGINPDTPVEDGLPEPKPGKKYKDRTVEQGFSGKVQKINVRTY